MEANQLSQDFYNVLHSVLASIPPTDMVTVLGDFNVWVGTDISTWHTLMGSDKLAKMDNSYWTVVPPINLSLQTLAIGFTTSVNISILGIAMVTAPTLVT